MSIETIAAAIRRVEDVMRRRPGQARKDDAPAVSRWRDGLRVVAAHPNGSEVLTDMPAEFGGAGDQVTPGWLFRAGMSSCLATSILIHAAARGIALSHLEVRTSSRSDPRGLLGMTDEADGRPVSAAAGDIEIHVRIAADGVAPERLQALVDDSSRLSPVQCTLAAAAPVRMHVDVGAATPA